MVEWSALCEKAVAKKVFKRLRTINYFLTEALPWMFYRVLNTFLCDFDFAQFSLSLSVSS